MTSQEPAAPFDVRVQVSWRLDSMTGAPRALMHRGGSYHRKTTGNLNWLLCAVRWADGAGPHCLICSHVSPLRNGPVSVGPLQLLPLHDSRRTTIVLRQ